MPSKRALSEPIERAAKRRRHHKSHRLPTSVEQWLSDVAATIPFEHPQTQQNQTSHNTSFCGETEEGPKLYSCKEESPRTSHFPDSMGSQTERSASSDRAESLSAYDPRFTDELERRNIFFADHEETPPPLNIDDILKIIDREECGATNAGSRHAKEYRKIIDSTGNEADVMQSLVPRILPIDSVRLSDFECALANQQWSRRILIQDDIRPSLAAPKPDQVLGFKPRRFRHSRALALLRQLACPAPQSSHLLVPYFIVEAKGEQGSRLVAKRQSLWAAVTILSILSKISAAAGTIDTDFYNQIHVMSVELTTETIQLSCYWAARDDATNEVAYYGKTFRCWCPNDPTGDGFESARRSISNAINWTRDHVFDRLNRDLERLETTLLHELPGQITPPVSDCRSRSRKRKTTLSSERSTSSLRNSFSA